MGHYKPLAARILAVRTAIGFSLSWKLLETGRRELCCERTFLHTYLESIIIASTRWGAHSSRHLVFKGLCYLQRQRNKMGEGLVWRA